MKKTLWFKVDASLIKELGERLIGRADIALGELIKNSFDADATTCRVVFGDDRIEVIDDGHGMDADSFEQFWMRVGTTHKLQKRESPGGRTMTGSKGLGRLATQFLADRLEITTARRRHPSLRAWVDWRDATNSSDLTSVGVKIEEKEVPNSDFPNNSNYGTKVTLLGLKQTWDTQTLETLGNSLWQLRSPFRQKGTDQEGFDIEIAASGIQGAEEAFNKGLERVFDNWRARIRGRLSDGRSGAKASITLEFKADYGADDAEEFKERVTLPVRPDWGEESLIDRCRFEILIFNLSGRQTAGLHVGELREYLQSYGNIGVYDNGFRLPYYGASVDPGGYDWLGLAADQARRLSVSELLPERLRVDGRYMLDLPAQGRVFGAVEISTQWERREVRGKGEYLEILSGRDRLHDNGAFRQLRDLIRYATDLYANRYRQRVLRQSEEDRDRESSVDTQKRALTVLERNKDEIPTRVYRELKKDVESAIKATEAHEEDLDRRAAILAPLASAGMAALALNHEIGRETRLLQDASARLRRLARRIGEPELVELADQFEAIRGRMLALQELFAPLLDESDKAAISRLKVRAVARQTVDAMRPVTPGVSYSTSGIPDDLYFPQGSFAEWSALIQNILSNAWNAMLQSETRNVVFVGGQRGRKSWLRISDTGRGLGVPLEEAAKFFQPFERGIELDDKLRAAALGGQGLGLAIVRMIASRRNASVRFVEPEEGFATTLEVGW